MYGQTPITKGSIFRLDNRRSIADKYVFQFNPETYQMDVGNSYRLSNSPGQYIPAASFKRFKGSTFRFQLFIYGRERNVPQSHGDVDVDQEMARLELFCAPGGEFSVTNPQFVSPGSAILVLGRRIVHGVIEGISFNVKMMDRQYNPVFLTADIVFHVTSSGLDADVTYLNNIRGRAGLSG